MSASDRPRVDTEAGQGDETFLARWSRRKAESRIEAIPAVAPAPPEATAPEPPLAVEPTAHEPARELPDIDQLGEDSDYSAFLTPGVDANLRRRALRKLFASPKFNEFDGLDTYRDDFTQFPALGAIVTADMRHHVERLAQKALEGVAAEPPPDEATTATTGTTATTAVLVEPPPAALPAPDEPCLGTPDEPSTPTPDEEDDDSPA